jgi:hypothetical protein
MADTDGGPPRRANPWGDDHLVEEVAREYVVRLGPIAALDAVEVEYDSAVERGDVLGAEAWTDIRDAIKRCASN